MRGGDARFLHKKQLVFEREFYMDWKAPENDQKHPVHYDVLEGKHYMFRSVKDRIRLQLHCLTTFLRSGCQFWVLDDFWTQAGSLSGISAATNDFNWKQQHFRVGHLQLCCFVTWF